MCCGRGGDLHKWKEAQVLRGWGGGGMREGGAGVGVGTGEQQPGAARPSLLYRHSLVNTCWVAFAG